VVARELGVSPSTLRTWERRYRLIVPHRGPGGERLYDSAQLEQLRGINQERRRGARAGAAHRSATLPGETQVARIALDPGLDAPSRARHAVDRLMSDFDDRKLVFFLRLITSELVTYAVVHGRGHSPIRVELERSPTAAGVRVHSDRPFSLKALRDRKRDTGRGLEIVEALADDWTIESGPLGTTIGAHLNAPG
jgi:DNA-binding transcriptional MerR regulator